MLRHSLWRCVVIIRQTFIITRIKSQTQMWNSSTATLLEKPGLRDAARIRSCRGRASNRVSVHDRCASSSAGRIKPVLTEPYVSAWPSFSNALMLFVDKLNGNGGNVNGCVLVWGLCICFLGCDKLLIYNHTLNKMQTLTNQINLWLFSLHHFLNVCTNLTP